MTTRDELLRDVADYVEFQLEEGETSVTMDREVLEALRTTATAAPVPAQSAAPTPAAPDTGDPDAALAAIAERIAACRNCRLCEKRTQVVPGQGTSRPEIAFVGEGPGAEEDKQGLAFVGRAGQLLTRMIDAMGLTRDEVWIGNIVKCRPPDNRVPMPDEMATCIPYLKEQLTILRPKVIVCLGATAVKGLLDTKIGITKLRGTWMSFEGIDVMPTLHPAYLLRNPPAKRGAWDDLQAVLKRLGKPVPKVKKS